MSKRTFRAGGLAVAELKGGHHLVGQFDNYGCFLGRLVRFLVIPSFSPGPSALALPSPWARLPGSKTRHKLVPLPPLPAALCI
jgi:hypothetical protein